MNEASHKKDINLTIDELIALSTQSGDPAPSSHQYIGTIIDNTIVFLVGVDNSLGGAPRSVEFSDFANWLSAMKAVHRSFLATLHSAVEKGMAKVSEENNFAVLPRRATDANKIISELEGSDTPVSRGIASRIRRLAGTNPSFDDYLESVIKNTLSRERQTFWRKFFRAFNIVRNKASHSDPTLTPQEKMILTEGGLECMCTEGELKIGVRMYAGICKRTLDFFDEVAGAIITQKA